ncbi:unnamed protein product [Kuraishia capsulata CBS 1993]|uniref:FAD-binding domain-containing protein n=1 Tax=Kuraishia capsulata CBS 1993 TaxID=1382522 RepID=W6MGU1_9ASCO|nr:uncharacterized protein KUCA_T00001374001 [Kuraishia capsulata CBS 1993]CDK25404.1 unnamed protein product [Kuraishia capsulata CBS 1993]
MKVIIVGAGLGGLSASISILLAGHEVLVLESANEIKEVGAGIQILPNASRILIEYGLRSQLEEVATMPQKCFMNGWKGKKLAELNFHEQAKRMGSPFWDFHRADLQRIMLERAKELGAQILVNCRVCSVNYNMDEMTVSATTAGGDSYTGDLLVGADGINSRLREILVGHADPPTPTGDLAYRVLLDGAKLLEHPSLAEFIENPQVNYWLGPQCHCVNYVLKKGKFFNFVLLCPDDVPEGMSICEGKIDQVKSVFAKWDPRVVDLLDLVESSTIDKWKLCYREGINKWYHESGMFCLLGDAVHATLPYLASGAGMAIEDGAVLGTILERFSSKSDLRESMRQYQNKRKTRTEKIVARGNLQQTLYHLDDGPAQEERDFILGLSDPPAGEAFVWRDKEMAPWLLGYNAFNDAKI